jgi:hypothetical protein
VPISALTPHRANAEDVSNPILGQMQAVLDRFDDLQERERDQAIADHHAKDASALEPYRKVPLVEFESLCPRT